MASKTPASQKVGGGKRVPDLGAKIGTKTPAVTRPDRDAKLRFRFDQVDETHWPLHDINTRDHKRLLKRLKHFEGMTLHQALTTGAISDYDMSNCPNKAAQKVLANQYDGQDSMTKLVIEPSGSLRLFGIREAHEIHVIWWDAKHEIWPEGKVKR